MAKFPSVSSQLTWAAELAQGKDVTLQSEPDLMLLSLAVAFSYLDLRIFANEGEAGLCCNVPATQLCVPKSMCCLVAARSISHIPEEETSCQFVSRRMLV